MNNPSKPADPFGPDHWQRFRARDRSVFEQVYARYHQRLLTYLATHYYFPLDTDSVAAESWLKVWANPAYDPREGHFFAWLLKIAKNTANSTLRTKKFRIMKQTESLVEASGQGLQYSEVDTESDLAECLARIGKACQEILRLGIEGFSYQEIADQLEIGVGTVGSRKSRCRQQLLDCINTQKS